MPADDLGRLRRHGVELGERVGQRAVGGEPEPVLVVALGAAVGRLAAGRRG